MKCGYCGHAGHVNCDCYTKIHEQQMITQLIAQLGTSSHQAHSATHDDHSNDDGQLKENMAVLNLDRDPTWYLNYAASSHLTSERS